MSMIGIVSAVWAFALLALFIPLVRISYQIERRSNPEKFVRWPLRHANPIGSALNMGVAKDAETQALRKKLLVLIAVIGVLFVALIIFILISLPD